MSVKSGTLEPLKLFKIFRSLLERRLSGELTLTRGQVVKKARLHEGRPVRVVSNVRRESLLGALQEQGIVDEARLEAVQRLREERGVSAERALVELGVLTPARLQMLEGSLARRRLVEAFGWRDGAYSFQEGADDGGAVTDGIDPVEVVLEAAARVIKQEDCQAFFAQYSGQVVRLTDWNRTYGGYYDRLFGQSNVRLLLVRPMTFDDLVREIGDEQRTARQLFGLIVGGLGTFGPGIGMSETTSPRIERPAPLRPPMPTSPTPPPGIGRQPTPVPLRGEPVGPRVEIARQPTPAPRVEVARTPAPRVEISRQPTPMAGQATPAPEAGRPVRLKPREPEPTPIRAEPTPARPAAPPKPATPTTDLPERQRRVLAEIDVLFRELQTRSHYELLGVDRQTDAEKIRGRFRQLARDYHVDRFARYGLHEDVTRKIQRVFMAINRAHEVLVDPEQRKEYDLSLEMAAKGHAVAPGAGVDASQVFRSEQLVRDGTLAVKNNNPKLAKTKFEQALEKNALDPVAKAGLAYADFMIAQSQGGSTTMAARVRDQLEQVATPDLNREEPFLYLGRVYRTLGDAAKAMRAFERALEINRHCAEAASELRHLQRKGDDPNAKKGAGLGLFGKKK
jgi:curved DNA-binding protein CbpA